LLAAPPKCLYISPRSSALRLAVQDVALSRRKHGFESRRARQRNAGARCSCVRTRPTCRSGIAQCCQSRSPRLFRVREIASLGRGFRRTRHWSVWAYRNDRCRRRRQPLVQKAFAGFLCFFIANIIRHYAFWTQAIRPYCHRTHLVKLLKERLPMGNARVWSLGWNLTRRLQRPNFGLLEIIFFAWVQMYRLSGRDEVQNNQGGLKKGSKCVRHGRTPRLIVC
jgi:hypothetical protein